MMRSTLQRSVAVSSSTAGSSSSTAMRLSGHRSVGRTLTTLATRPRAAAIPLRRPAPQLSSSSSSSRQLHRTSAAREISDVGSPGSPRPRSSRHDARTRSQRQQEQRDRNDTHTRTASQQVPFLVRIQPLLLGLSAVGIVAYHFSRSPLYLEAPAPGAGGGMVMNVQGVEMTATDLTQQEQMRRRAKTQGLYVWGSNRYNVVAPDAPLMTLVRSPRSIPYFDGMALRGLLLEEKHAAAIDANGDLIQWGLGFFDASSRTKRSAVSSGDIEEVPLGRRRDRIRANELVPLGSEVAQPRAPERTLVGKDLVKVVGSDTKVFALGKNGQVYVLSAVQILQQPGKKAGWSWNPLTLFGVLAARNVDHEALAPAAHCKLARGEKVVDIDAGISHLVALTNPGRTFSCPIDSRANDYGQLGTKRVLLNSPAAGDTTRKQGKVVEATLEPRMFRLDEFLENEQKLNLTNLLPDWALPPTVAEKGKEGLKPQKLPYSPSSHPIVRLPPGASAAARKAAQDDAERRAREMAEMVTEPDTSIRYCTTLHEIPSLRTTTVDQISVGNEHSLARTSEGRVLAWGRHTHGQCGLGSQIAMECVPVPSEVVLSKCFSNNSIDVSCTAVRAGADNSFFVTQRREAGSQMRGGGWKIDVLAAGKGQWGTLGNAMWSQVAASPVRVKTVSGLLEYSESTNQTHPVDIYSLTVGRPGHVALVLDTVDPDSHAAFGRDVMVWGHNAAFQLGNGKRANLSVPQHLPPLPALTKALGGEAPLLAEEAPSEKERQRLREADINSGALTHMPHNRLQMGNRAKVDTRGSLDAKPGSKRGVTLEEEIYAGSVASAVYWKMHL